MAPSKPTAIARLQIRVADLEEQLTHANRRAKAAEVKLQHLKNMAETAEEDIETGADHYHSPVIPVSALRRDKLI